MAAVSKLPPATGASLLYINIKLYPLITHTRVYIYIYRGRERERKRASDVVLFNIVIHFYVNTHTAQTNYHRYYLLS